MLSLTAHLVLISTIIVKCSAFSKKPSERAKPAAVKKAVEDKQPVKVTAFEQASLNEEKAEAMSNIEPSPKISNSTVPTAPTPKKEKKVVATTKKTERSVAQGPPLVSEHIKDEKKMPSVHKPIRKGSIYANELLTAKPLTDTEPELHPDNHVVKAKSPKPVARTPTARHRNALKPGKINDKSDDTLHDAPSIQKVGGPSYEDAASVNEKEKDVNPK